jgi:hypothetical protein
MKVIFMKICTAVICAVFSLLAGKSLSAHPKAEGRKMSSSVQSTLPSPEAASASVPADQPKSSEPPSSRYSAERA